MRGNSWRRWSWVLLLLAIACLPQARTTAAQPVAPSVATRQEVHFSKHALSRMAQRGVSRAHVLQIIKTSKPFRYYHKTHWETGYYDAASDIFVAASNGLIITVITHATPHYVEDLKSAAP